MREKSTVFTIFVIVVDITAKLCITIQFSAKVAFEDNEVLPQSLLFKKYKSKLLLNYYVTYNYTFGKRIK